MNDDQDDEKFKMMPWGDIGLFVAGFIFLALSLWMAFGPMPFIGMFEQVKQPPAENSEITVTLPQKPKEQPK